MKLTTTHNLIRANNMTDKKLDNCPFCGSTPQKIIRGNSKGRVRCGGKTPGGRNCRIAKLTWPIDAWQERSIDSNLLDNIQSKAVGAMLNIAKPDLNKATSYCERIIDLINHYRK